MDEVWVFIGASAEVLDHVPSLLTPLIWTFRSRELIESTLAHHIGTVIWERDARGWTLVDGDGVILGRVEQLVVHKTRDSALAEMFRTDHFDADVCVNADLDGEDT